MCSGSEAGSFLGLIDSCITQLKAHGPSGTCNESEEEEGRYLSMVMPAGPILALEAAGAHRLLHHSILGLRVIKKKQRRWGCTCPW